jgi:hypothetical protein
MGAKWVLAGMWLGVLIAGALAQTTRTPDGMLWAGTTFALRAVATDATGRPLTLSNETQVQVGQVVRWQWEYETPPYLTTSTSDGWFSVIVRNKGNGVDALHLKTATSEGAGTSPWQIDLLEQLGADQLFGKASAVGEFTSLFMPSESRRLFIRARPPSDRNTDGVFLTLKMSSVSNPQILANADFVAGAETQIWTHTSLSTWINYPLVSSPALLSGRLYWVIASAGDVRLFCTNQPLNAESTFQNGARYLAKIIGLLPAGRGAVVGNNWYLVDVQGNIAFFNWATLTEGSTIYPSWVSLDGRFADPNLPLLSDGARLYFIYSDRQIGVYTPALNQVSRIEVNQPDRVVQMQMLPNNFLFVGRTGGRFDLVWFGMLQESGSSLSGTGEIVGATVDGRRGTLLVARGTRLGCYRPLARQWLWVVSAHAPLVSPPAYDPSTDSVYALTRDGWLYGWDASSGSLRMFYPQPLISDAPVVKAVLRAATRADRKVPYIYLAAQLDMNGTLATRVFQVTAVNPFNRFYSTSVVDGAVLGDDLLFTGTTASDLMLVWCWRGGDGNRGRFYGFRLR